MKSILLTGVAGFIGSHLAEAILKDARFSEYRILGLDNFDPFYARSLKERNLSWLAEQERFELVEGFSGNAELLKSIFADKPIEGVIHLAARAGVGPSLKDPEAYSYLNITGSLPLFFSAGAAGVKQFLFASSSSVYGKDSSTPFREDQACLQPVSPYAATKRACEIIAWNAHHLTQLPMTVLRFFTVYGPRQRPEMAIAKFSSSIMESKSIPIYGDGSFSRDFTYIDDIVNGILDSYWYRHGETHFEIFNLGNSKTLSVNKLIDLLENSIGMKALRDYVPTPPGEMLATCADIGRAKAAFGYQPRISIQEGVSRYIDWMKSNRETNFQKALNS